MTGTLAYVGQRTLLIAFTALAVSSIVFIGIHQLPGDAFVSERLRPSQQAALLHQFGLDRPLLVQYRDFISNLVLRGDLGESIQSRGTKITPLVLREATVSAEVGGAALVFTIGLGLMFGVFGAMRQNSWIDYLLTTLSVVGYSMPSFVIATFLLLVFGIWLENLTGGSFFYGIGWTGTYGNLAEISVPAFALGFPYASFVARLTRASMLEIIRQDYIRTARAKGLVEQIVIIRHALRNALIPVITILGPLVIGIITGSVVIENIFGIPGLGKEFVTSILNRDYNITVGVFTGYAALIGLANLAVDLLYPVLDPRIRY
ncbi:MAG TPA: ABC transporter permease [Candidatus Dormibacteraeota bacterium]|nr:ABC transporter permease [Candidatus Dormibacteraeota bacterium]